MSRPIVGTDLRQIIPDEPHDLPHGLEFRDDHGVYWKYDTDDHCHALTGGNVYVRTLINVLTATDTAVVTYVPPVACPYTEPGWYVCSGACAYRFLLHESGLWGGPWSAGGRRIDARAMFAWQELTDGPYGDCSRSLVGPVNPVVLTPVDTD